MKTKNKQCIEFVLLIALFTSFFALGFVYHSSIVFDPQTWESIDKEHYITDFSKEAVNKLNKFFEETKENEFKVCLVGYKKENKVYVETVDDFELGDNQSVFYTGCDDEGDVGVLHKHPNGIKHPSHEDLIASYKHFNKDGNYINVIMYDYGKFNVMTPSKFWGNNLEVFYND